MRRAITVSLAVTAALAAAVLVAGVSSARGESGPKCADITGETHGPTNFYNATTETGTLNVQFLLASGTDCKQLTYTLVVSGITGSPIVISQKGSSTFLGINYSDTDGTVCISGTTASNGGHVHDAAPDTSCIEITSGTTGGGSGFS
jgi:hypothetical protein